MCHYVHQCHVLHVLAEWSHQRRIAQLGPHIFYFVEQHHKQIVDAELRLIIIPKYHIDTGMYSFQIGHHRPHHPTR